MTVINTPIRGTLTRYTIANIGLNQSLCIDHLDPEKDQICSGVLPIRFKNDPLQFYPKKTHSKEFYARVQ